MPISDKMEFLHDTQAAIVVFGRQVSCTPAWLSLITNIKGAARNLDVLIYDNSPEAQEPPNHDGLKVSYIHDKINSGVSKAYNIAGRLAAQNGKNWLLLLDQDTWIPDGGLAAYGTALSSHPDGQFFAPRVNDENGLLSPFRFRWGSGRRLKAFQDKTINLKIHKVINSGIFISSSLFQRTNGYNESIPLDFSDIAFCEQVALLEPLGYVVDIELQTQFSDNRAANLDEAIQRFTRYCIGADEFAAISESGVVDINLRKFLRAIRLSLVYRNMNFIKLSRRPGRS